jgi:hypothetical protein
MEAGMAVAKILPTSLLLVTRTEFFGAVIRRGFPTQEANGAGA